MVRESPDQRSELATLQAINEALAGALERERRLAAQLEALDEAARDLAAALAPEAVLQRIADRARLLVGARYAALGVFDERRNIRQFITSGISESERAAIGQLPHGRGLLGALLREGKPIRLRDLGRDPRSAGFPSHHPPMRSFLGVPIVLHGRNVGNLYLTEKEGADEFSAEDEALIVRLARHAAVAIENARLYAAAVAERRRLQTILDTLPDGVLLADATRGGAIVMFNAAAVRLWGAPPVTLYEGRGDTGTRRHGDTATRGHGDTGTRRRGDTAIESHSDDLTLAVSPRPRVPASPPAPAEAEPVAYARPPGVRFFLPDGTRLDVEALPLSRALRGETLLGTELIIEQPSGRRVPTIASAAPLHDADGVLTGAVAAFQDVTPLKEAERLKREFLSMVTHELRTPLTGIKGIISGLLAEDVTLDPAETRQLLGLVDEAADHLARLVTNLLDMSRLEGGALDLEPEPFHVSDIVAAALRETAGVLRAHRVQVDVPAELPEVWADYSQAKRVLVNLLANAAKYAPEGSVVTVSARRGDAGTRGRGDAGTRREGDTARGRHGDTARERDGAEEREIAVSPRPRVPASPSVVVISVRDEGKGIRPEELPRIFDRFYRGAGRPVRGQAGTGLGLAIAKGLVEAMGGRIWTESNPGQGATFSFTLPMS